MPPIIQSVLPFLNKLSDSPSGIGPEFGSENSRNASTEIPSDPNELKGFQAFAREVSGFLKKNNSSDTQFSDLGAADNADSRAELEDADALVGKDLQLEGRNLPGLPDMHASDSVSSTKDEEATGADQRLPSLVLERIAPAEHGQVADQTLHQRPDQKLDASTSVPFLRGSAAPENQDIGLVQEIAADTSTANTLGSANKGAIQNELSIDITDTSEQVPTTQVPHAIPSAASVPSARDLAAPLPSDSPLESQLSAQSQSPSLWSGRSSDLVDNQQTREVNTQAEATNLKRMPETQLGSWFSPESAGASSSEMAVSHKTQETKLLSESAFITDQRITKFDFDRFRIDSSGLDISLDEASALKDAVPANEKALGAASGLAPESMASFKETDLAKLAADSTRLLDAGGKAAASEVSAGLFSEASGSSGFSSSSGSLLSALPPSALSNSLSTSMSPSGLNLQDSLIQQALTSDITEKHWGGEVGGRIRLMMSAGISQAQMELNPAELGRMDILLSSEGDSTKLSFVVQNAMAKEALDLQLPRLREALAEQGISLEDTSVKDQSQQDAGAGGQKEQALVTSDAEDQVWDKEVALEIPANLDAIHSQNQSSNGIDAYA